jgi:hypothetical protein
MKRQPPSVRKKFEACFVGDVVISAITLAELECGITCSAVFGFLIPRMINVVKPDARQPDRSAASRRLRPKQTPKCHPWCFVAAL